MRLIMLLALITISVSCGQIQELINGKDKNKSSTSKKKKQNGEEESKFQLLNRFEYVINITDQPEAVQIPEIFAGSTISDQQVYSAPTHDAFSASGASEPQTTSFIDPLVFSLPSLEARYPFYAAEDSIEHEGVSFTFQQALDAVQGYLEKIGLYFNNEETFLPIRKYTVKQVSLTCGSSECYDFSNASLSAIEFNNALYFVALDSNAWSKIYKLNQDGQVIQISNTRPSGYDYPSQLTLFNNELYFIAANASGHNKIFRISSDDSVNQVTNIRNGASDTETYYQLAVFDNYLYFAGYNTGGYTKLFKISSSHEVTQMSNIKNGAHDNIGNLYPYHNSLYFTANLTGTTFVKLFKINSSGSVTQVSNINNGATDGTIQFLTGHGDFLYFQGRKGSYSKLFRVNAAAEVAQVSNTLSGGNDSAQPMIVFNNSLYFVSRITGSKNKLFKVNQAGEVTQVTNNVNGDSDNIAYIKILNNKMYFFARDNNWLVKLFSVDENDEVKQVSNIYVESNDGNTIHIPIVFNNELYFVGYDELNNYKIFKMNEHEEISQVSKFNTEEGMTADADTFTTFASFNNKLYYRGLGAWSRSKLFEISIAE